MVKLKNATERIKEFHKTSGNRDCRICKRFANNICMDFNIFVCPVCSGVMREYNFKIKGISMTSWSNDDAEKICGSGGNATDLALNGRESIHREATDVEIRQWVKSTYVDKKKGPLNSTTGAGISASKLEEDASQLANMFPADISKARAKELIRKYGSIEQAIDEYLTEKEKNMHIDKAKKKTTEKKKAEAKKKKRPIEKKAPFTPREEPVSEMFASFGDGLDHNSAKGTPHFGAAAPESSPPTRFSNADYNDNSQRQSTSLNWAQRIAEQNQQLAEQQQQQQMMMQQQQQMQQQQMMLENQRREQERLQQEQQLALQSQQQLALQTQQQQLALQQQPQQQLALQSQQQYGMQQQQLALQQQQLQRQQQQQLALQTPQQQHQGIMQPDMSPMQAYNNRMAMSQQPSYSSGHQVSQMSMQQQQPMQRNMGMNSASPFQQNPTPQMMQQNIQQQNIQPNQQQQLMLQNQQNNNIQPNQQQMMMQQRMNQQQMQQQQMNMMQQKNQINFMNNIQQNRMQNNFAGNTNDNSMYSHHQLAMAQKRFNTNPFNTAIEVSSGRAHGRSTNPFD